MRDSPTWFSEETDFSLFPDSEKASLPSGNRVIIDYDPSAVGVTNPKIVFGGLDASKSTAGNRVVLINGRVEDVIFGGLSYKAVSENNIVTILGGSVAEDVIGGFSVSGVALRNIVIVSGGSVGDYVYGGAGEEGAAGNSVTISGGSVEGSVRGGISDGKDATDNIVTIGGGSVKGEIYGGESVRGAAAGNTVTISGGFVEGEVCGGWTYRGNATNNTVTISGKPNMAKTYIKGGQPVNESVDTITGNILNFKSSGVSVKGVGNFERYNFYLPASTVVGGTMLGVTGTVDLKGTTCKSSCKTAAS